MTEDLRVILTLVLALALFFAVLSHSSGIDALPGAMSSFVSVSGIEILNSVTSFLASTSGAGALQGAGFFCAQTSGIDALRAMTWSFFAPISGPGALRRVITFSFSIVFSISYTVPFIADQLAKRVNTISLNCDTGHCPVSLSQYGYRPSFSGNVALLVTWFVLGITHFAGMIVLRKYTFSALVLCGCIMEAAGYGARVYSYQDPFMATSFIVQISCLTLAPNLFSASQYLCLSYTVQRVSTEFSRFKPKFYIMIFSVADAVSFLVQGAGGALVAWRATAGEGPGYATYVLLAGLAFQVLSMAFFVIFCTEYGVQIYKQRKLFTQRARHDADSAHIDRLIRSRTIWCFAFFLFLSTFCIFIRCVYRVFELSQGWYGPVAKNQGMFMGFESAMVIAAVAFLMPGHPGLMEGRYWNIHNDWPDIELQPLEPLQPPLPGRVRRVRFA